MPGDVSPAVKLVIWDLDDTLWSGTLAENEETRLLDGRAEILRALVDRGIMCSISSKNDEARVRQRLSDLGLWDLFVFPRVNWEPKGAQIRDLIEAAQLRPANVLFVDDSALNREEASHFASGIQTADPADPRLDSILAAVIASGKDDHQRQRLAEYRILEAKAKASSAYADNVEFLRSCDIHVSLAIRPITDVVRIHELIGRTNQLNYIKRRIDLDGVRELVASEAVDSMAIRVRDRFGDYGLVGFAAVRGGAVEQLAFSCRILGMGVERAIYARLGSPVIDVVEPVSAPLTGPSPDWLKIEEVTTLLEGRPSAPAGAEGLAASTGARAGGRRRPSGQVLFVGGCDLESAVAFLPRMEQVTTYFNYSPPDRPRLIVHRDSIDFLMSDQLTDAQRAYVLETAPFLDEQVFSPPDWRAYADIVYSPLIDYIQAKYANPAVPDFFCSFGDQLQPVIDAGRITRISERYGLSAAALERFADAWRPTEKPIDVWRRQLEGLFRRMSTADSVTVILGATETYSDLDRDRLAFHRHANQLIRDVATDFSRVSCLEVDPFIRGPEDFSNAVRHYSRRVYREIGEALGARIGGGARRPEQRTPGAPLALGARVAHRLGRRARAVVSRGRNP